MRIVNAIVLFSVAMLAFACAQKDTGNFKINLKLPENIINNCATDWKYEDFVDDFCIVKNDSIELTVFSTDKMSNPYVLDETKIFPVTGQTSGDTEFSRSLRTNRYYKFFVKITNEREKVKLTGGVEGIYYEETKNFEVNIFLGLAGDFVRLVSDQNEKSSLETYIPEDEGSSGARAAVFKDGRVFLAGGAVFNSNGDEIFEKSTNFISTKDLKVEKGPSLKEAVKDHVVALLDATGSNTGKMVIAFGATQNGYNNKVYLFDPDKNSIETKGGSFTGGAHARALTIGGEVYISGGCDAGAASPQVIKIDKAGNASIWQTMKQGRCLHGMVDVSYKDGEGVLHPAILVFGGAKKNIFDSTNRDLIGYNGESFAEIIDESGVADIAIAGVGCQTSGDQTLCFTLAGHAATRITWDDANKGPTADVVAVASAGFIQSANDADLTLSLNNYVIRGVGDSTKPRELAWTLNSYGTSIKCAYADMAPISSPESFPVQYAALNCGTGDSVARSYDKRVEQQVYVIEVRAAPKTGSDGFDLVASARAGITGASTDINNPGLFLDGPVAVNHFGQAFLFGTRYVYLVSGFSYGTY
ncbi:MAG TPA: hypothetical protein PLV42_01650 [bacterium]|nr:hypothetical protein [bacterium]